MSTMMTTILAIVVAGWSSTAGLAQVPKPVQPDLARLADGKGVQLFNRALTVAREDGRTVARLDARAGDGGAVIEGVLAGDVVIEVDLKGKDVAQQSFLGIAFHLVDWTTFDAVYFRPFNFRAPDAERRSHSVQYVSHPVNTWQKLRAEQPGRFEKAIEPPPDPNGWFHARIVMADSKVEVYVDHAAKPSLVVDDLGAAKSGGVALFVGNGSDGAFADLKITPTAPTGPPPASTQNIFQAAGTGNLARVRALVEADPKEVNARDSFDRTPIHVAVQYNQRAVVDYLISKGADVNAVARHSGTPLDGPYEARNQPMIEWLQARGARVTPIRFDVFELTPSIHRVAFPWGMMNNVLVFSGNDGAVIVDTGFSTRALGELKKTIDGFSKAGVRWVINSHAHGDHVAGNAIAPSPAAVVTAATLTGNTAGLPITRDGEPLKGRSGRTLPAPCTLHTGGADIKLIVRPGLHSDADLIVYFPKESVVAMGDLLLSESIPAVDDLPGYMAFLEDVLDVFPENTTFVSGHGRDLTASGVRAYRDALNAMIGIVRTNLAAGRTVDQMVQDDVLKAYRAQYSLLAFLTPDRVIPRVVSALQKGTLK